MHELIANRSVGVIAKKYLKCTFAYREVVRDALSWVAGVEFLAVVPSELLVVPQLNSPYCQ